MTQKPIISNKSRIVFGEKSYSDLQELLSTKKYTAIFILVDTNTKRMCLQNFLEKNPGLITTKIIVMEAGEAFKNLKTCTHIWQRLSEEGADRNSVLINLGGGVVTDLGGFVACAFKRGIDFINIPTTLLAMVDASVGGKTGIDFGNLKNQIGIIQEPRLVIVDPYWLQTLSQREINSGFAEMLKHGLIAEASYWEALSMTNPNSFEDIIPLIYKSVIIKNEVVLKDPYEAKERKSLNFGHTLGHAIESYFLSNQNEKTLLHGEAIAIGMVLEAYLSHSYCGLPMDIIHSIKSVFGNIFSKVSFSKSAIQEITQLLKHDKKNKGKTMNYVLLEKIGSTRLDVQVSSEKCLEAFTYYQA